MLLPSSTEDQMSRQLPPKHRKRAVKVPAGVEESGVDASLWGETYETTADLVYALEEASGRRWAVAGKGEST
ncbi:hypothetical protein KIPB_000579 [Kipferlia bialata]|uniref:Uncharacterized protein n=1 Tax=Kipferlia bialata TaxID=797122 RepID=A0A391NRM3_9EUKA|nr:hypothetical protein KIPB_000579 [Kipferlia bialata]|eukprot:g579.t1